MILLDTNVISELMKAAPDPAVTAWLGRQAGESLATSAITLAELEEGLARLPDGAKRLALRAALAGLLDGDAGLPVCVFDEAAAGAYGRLVTQRVQAGLHISRIDHMIAAIALEAGAAIATRNVSDFNGCGLTVHNPWDAA